MGYFLTNKSRIGKPINKDYKRVKNNSWHDNSHDNNSGLFMVTECSNLNNFDDVLYRGKSIKGTVWWACQNISMIRSGWCITTSSGLLIGFMIGNRKIRNWMLTKMIRYVLLCFINYYISRFISQLYTWCNWTVWIIYHTVHNL